jgi:hypothetical protein
MPYNGYAHNLRAPLKGFRGEYVARRQTAKAAHALGPEARKTVDGANAPSSAEDRLVQGFVMRRRRSRGTIQRSFQPAARKQLAYSLSQDR